MAGIRTGIFAIVASLCAASCGDDTEARLRAIDEVEQACGVPAGFLTRSEIGQRFNIPEGSSDSEAERIAKTILVGSRENSQEILSKRPCIIDYRSRDGYSFLLYGSENSVDYPLPKD